MARRGRRKQHAMDPMLSHGILAILILILAIIIVLAFFGKAGTVGIILNEWILSFIFGRTRYFVPLVLVVLAWYMVVDTKYDYRPTHGIGAVLFFLSLSSLLHMGYSTDRMWLEALEGNGGGVFGMLAWPMQTYFGTIAAWIILIGVIAISLILLFNTSLVHFVEAHRKLMDKMGGAGSGIRKTVDKLFVEHEEEDEEEEWDDEEEFEEDEEPARSRFIQRRVGADEAEEDEEDLEEDEEDFAEEEKEEAPEEAPEPKEAEGPKTHQVPVEPELPMWQQNVIVRKPPSVNLLDTHKGKPTSGDIDKNAGIIEDTLEQFNIPVEMDEVRVGPSVTQFSFRPAKGVKLSKITSLTNDLALALAAHPIRIEAPIPGKSLVGIEVPNKKTAMVTLKELIQNKAYKERKHDMMIGLGRDVGGKVWFADLPRMPHLLIAGATGSGKTVCMNTVICSLLYQNTAETLRMIMVDPKRVELTLYNGIPHLLTPVITNVQQTVNALKWTISEMDRRFELLAKAGNRDIHTYNKDNPETKLPHLVFIIDELADLMTNAGNEVEAGIIRLAQMARAVGIHLILATQRPSVDVITGLMKANIPGRIAFSVASLTDSRTILDTSGAEKLIGKGDMLLMTSDLSKPVRIQGAFISENEVKKIVKYLKGKGTPVYDESIVAKGGAGGTMSMFGGPNDDQDPLFHEAKSVIIEAGKASASFLQRRLKVGYARAARILDELEDAGIVGPSQGSKPRELLLTETEIDGTMDMGGEANVFHQDAPEEPEEDEDEELYDDEDDEIEDDEYDYDEEAEEEKEDENEEDVEDGVDEEEDEEPEEGDVDEDDYDEEEEDESDDEEYEEEEEEEEEDDDDDRSSQKTSSHGIREISP